MGYYSDLIGKLYYHDKDYAAKQKVERMMDDEWWISFMRVGVHGLSWPRGADLKYHYYFDELRVLLDKCYMRGVLISGAFLYTGDDRVDHGVILVRNNHMTVHPADFKTLSYEVDNDDTVALAWIGKLRVPKPKTRYECKFRYADRSTFKRDQIEYCYHLKNSIEFYSDIIEWCMILHEHMSALTMCTMLQYLGEWVYLTTKYDVDDTMVYNVYKSIARLRHGG